MAVNAYHALASSGTEKPTFNVEEEVVVIRNGWTPKKRRRRQLKNHRYHKWKKQSPLEARTTKSHMTCEVVIHKRLYSNVEVNRHRAEFANW